jgi:hypothetical protein
MDSHFETLLQKVLSNKSCILLDHNIGSQPKYITGNPNEDYIEATYYILKMQQKKIEELEERLKQFDKPLLIHDEESYLEDPRRTR